jgi:cation diffusion facilitator CzcD-associated flavoprotein CzcO
MSERTDAGRPEKVCVVGAGPSGLIVARQLRSAGIPFDVYEKHSDVGGIWDQENPGSPVYNSAHFISSKHTSYFYGFPMPDSYPDYPSWRQLRDYIRAFARGYGLYEHITFSAPVETARLAGDGEWLVTAGGQQRRYRALLAAPGVTWHPNLPSYPGLDTFGGQARPAGVVVPEDPGELIDAIVGDLTRYGLPAPDHAALASHPIVNTQIIHHLSHGDITAKPDVARFTSQGAVFADGSEERIDPAIFATGYDYRIPFVEESLFEWRQGHPQLYLNVFNRAVDSLYVLGFIEFADAA